MNATRRDFLGGLLASSGLVGCGSLPLAGGGRPLLRFGVVSDVHVRLASGGESLEAGYDTATFERTLEYYRDSGVDAVVIAGDMADTGLLGELKAVADAWYRVFPNDRAPDGRKVERVFVFGNHDAFGLKNGKRVFGDMDRVRREAIEADPMRAWDICFHEEWKPYFKKTVKGFDFFGAHWAPGIWCNGIAEAACSGCIEAFRGPMAKSDPSKPFFYVQHPHPRDTVYGKGAWGVDDGSASELLRAFPQAVAFSGHSHEPLTNERAIWRGEYTSVATGSLRYLSAHSLWNRVRTAGYENGLCNFYLAGVTRADRPAYTAKYDAPKVMESQLSRMDIRVGMLVSVYADRIELAKREFESGLPLEDDWVVELPSRPRGFSVGRKAARPAEFARGAKLAVRLETRKTRGVKGNNGTFTAQKDVPALRLEFPAAIAGGRVAEYEISSENAAGERFSTRICAVGGLYPRRHANFAKDVVAAVPASALPAGAGQVRVTPLDSFGNRGRSIVAALDMGKHFTQKV